MNLKQPNKTKNMFSSLKVSTKNINMLRKYLISVFIKMGLRYIYKFDFYRKYLLVLGIDTVV